MITSLDLESIIISLMIDGGIEEEISGNIYSEGNRPINSNKEDVVVNTLDINIDTSPQTALSNINIYVPDKVVKVNGKSQYFSNKDRMRRISERILGIMRDTIVTGMTITPTNQYILSEIEIHQHYMNIRLRWNIQIDVLLRNLATNGGKYITTSEGRKITLIN